MHPTVQMYIPKRTGPEQSKRTLNRLSVHRAQTRVTRP